MWTSDLDIWIHPGNNSVAVVPFSHDLELHSRLPSKRKQQEGSLMGRPGIQYEIINLTMFVIHHTIIIKKKNMSRMPVLTISRSADSTLLSDICMQHASHVYDLVEKQNYLFCSNYILMKEVCSIFIESIKRE